MFKIKNTLIGTMLAISSLAVQANGVGAHQLIDETTAAQNGYDLQGLQWVSGIETMGIDVRWSPDFVDTRYATAEEVTALLIGADLVHIDLVIGNGREVHELQYGGSDLKLTTQSRCNIDTEAVSDTTLCTLKEAHQFSFEFIERWIPNNVYTAQLLIVNPDYIKPKDAFEWDQYSEVSPSDGAQLDLSGLTWMRFKTIAHMSSLEVKTALADGGSLSDWRWATATELGTLLKSDHDLEFQKVFLGSTPMHFTNLFYAGLAVNAAECSPLAEDTERKSLDTSCGIMFPNGDATWAYNLVYGDFQFKRFTFVEGSSNHAVALVKK